jgi:hypothetical protein
MGGDYCVWRLLSELSCCIGWVICFPELPPGHVSIVDVLATPRKSRCLELAQGQTAFVFALPSIASNSGTNSGTKDQTSSSGLS